MADLWSNRPFCSNDLMIASENMKRRQSIKVIVHTENQNRFFFHKCSIKKSLAVLNTRSIIFVAMLNACTYIYTFLLFWKLKQKSFYYGTTRLYGHGCKIAVSGGCKLKLFFNQEDWRDTRFLVKFNFPRWSYFEFAWLPILDTILHR